MSILLYGVAFILVLGTMIIIHEFGHFSMAKLLGIKVETFSVGFGPRLAGFRKGGTDYRLSAIPLGGYVKMKGENVDEELTGDPDEFSSRPRWHRLLVATAGPALNIATAFAIPFVVAMVGIIVPQYQAEPAVVGELRSDSPAAKAGILSGDRIIRFAEKKNPTWRDVGDETLVNTGAPIDTQVLRNGQTLNFQITPLVQQFQGEKVGFTGLRPQIPTGPVTVASVTSGMPAEKAGIKPGDKIVSLNGVEVTDFESLASEINRSANKPITLGIEREGRVREIAITPVEERGLGRIGFLPTAGPQALMRLRPVEALRYSAKENYRIIHITRIAFGQVLSGKRGIRDTLAGPIQIAQASGQALEQGGPSQLIFLIGFLSLNLGIFNLLPIPVLDGGMIFMLFIEFVLSIFGKPFSLRAREKMIQVGFVLLLVIMGFVIFNDISRIASSSPEPAPQQSPAK